MAQTARNAVPQIFVSYSHVDQKFSMRLVEDLRAVLGDSAVWYDTLGTSDSTLNYGSAWWESIQEEIRTRNVFIVILSPDALKSEWVQREMALALEQSQRGAKHLLPILYRDCVLPENWERFHFLQVSDPATDTRAYADQLAKLFDALIDIAYPQLANDFDAIKRSAPRTPLAKLTIGLRILVSMVALVAYWLLIGFVGFSTQWIFPRNVLRISGYEPFVIALRGNSRQNQLFKQLIVFLGLVIDWLAVGLFLSWLWPHSSILAQPYTTFSWAFAGISALVVCLIILIYVFLRKWPYLNVINIRKTILVIVVTLFLGLASQVQFFGAEFLYFPVVAVSFAVGVFISRLTSLGFSSFADGPVSLSASLHRLLWEQKIDERRSQLYNDWMKG